MDPLKLMSDNKALMGFSLNFMFNQAEVFSGLLNDLEAYKLDPPTIGKTFNFKDMHQALTYFQTGKNIGKVVVNIKKE